MNKGYLKLVNQKLERLPQENGHQFLKSCGPFIYHGEIVQECYALGLHLSEFGLEKLQSILNNTLGILIQN